MFDTVEIRLGPVSYFPFHLALYLHFVLQVLYALPQHLYQLPLVIKPCGGYLAFTVSLAILPNISSPSDTNETGAPASLVSFHSPLSMQNITWLFDNCGMLQ